MRQARLWLSKGRRKLRRLEGRDERKTGQAKGATAFSALVPRFARFAAFLQSWSLPSTPRPVSPLFYSVLIAFLSLKLRVLTDTPAFPITIGSTRPQNLLSAPASERIPRGASAWPCVCRQGEGDVSSPAFQLCLAERSPGDVILGLRGDNSMQGRV